jgi:CRP-like cAMP-binding protein
MRFKRKQVIYHQGADADAMFYILSGDVKLTVVSSTGKEATLMLLTANDFLGEESIAGETRFRQATASAATECKVLKIDRNEMIRVLHEESAFSDLFLKFLMARALRTQADLIDHLFNSSERRLARALLLMAGYGKAEKPEALIPRITQETLAEMIGTTRPRVSYFMNRFRKLGYIEYKGRILVHKSLLNVILRDQLSGIHPSRIASAAPPSLSPGSAKSTRGKHV